jgi:hypothetical protein
MDRDRLVSLLASNHSYLWAVYRGYTPSVSDALLHQPAP